MGFPRGFYINGDLDTAVGVLSNNTIAGNQRRWPARAASGALPLTAEPAERLSAVEL